MVVLDPPVLTCHHVVVGTLLFILLLLAPPPLVVSWTFSSSAPHTSWKVTKRTRLSQSKTPSPSQQDEETDGLPFRFHIRDCQHVELGACADLIMKSFYNETIQNPWRQLYRMGELNRIQQSFPYGDSRAEHKMLVMTAVPTQSSSSSTSTRGKCQIVGFVDVDARTPNRPTGYTYNPRPYLSDLCIHPDFRRQGLGLALIRACEDFCLREMPIDDRRESSMRKNQSAAAADGHHHHDTNKRSELYIRVEATNAAAVRMYHSLGYSSIHNPDDPDGETILILHKELGRRGEELSRPATKTRTTLNAEDKDGNKKDELERLREDVELFFSNSSTSSRVG